jgi:hypothetical protein
MKTIPKVLAWTVAALAVQAESRAQSAATDAVTESKRSSGGVATVRVDGMPTALLGATPKQAIEALYPMLPVLGLDHLPKAPLFDIQIRQKSNAALLSELGDRLGLSIKEADATADFLLVRNLTNPQPTGWLRAHADDLAENAAGFRGPQGVVETDPADRLFNAYAVSMTDFVHFLSDHTTKPVWNQTSLTGRYSFSFRMPGDPARALAEMGFDVYTRRRTTRCVVIAPKAR